MQQHRRLLSSAALVAMLGGGGPAAWAERPVRSLLEYRYEGLVAQHWDNSCAAAALATLLTFYHATPVTEAEVAQRMLAHGDAARVQARAGFSLLDMKGEVGRRGYAGVGFADMTLTDLRQWAPMIVPLKLRGYQHFVVVRSVQGQRVRIGDPAFGNYVMDAAAFQRKWPGIGFRIDRPQRVRTR